MALVWMPQILTVEVNIGSGNGLALLGNKPLHETIWPRYMLPYGVNIMFLSECV